ncbi:MAG: hypothetical protein JXB14_01235 [Candidatus Altiarchaeota archaeon]|nr:hypothetical protein [Candidatus Altiarchaeota archaeon]
MSVKDAKKDILKLVKKYENKGEDLWRNKITKELNLNPNTFKKAVAELEKEGKIKTKMGIVDETVEVNRKRRALLFTTKNG